MNKDVFVLSLLKTKSGKIDTVAKYIIENDINLEKCIANLNLFLNKKEREFFKAFQKEVKESIKLNHNKGIKTITIFDKRFPEKLYKTNTGKCIYLFYKGDISLLNRRCIAVIGARAIRKPYMKYGEIATQKLLNDYVIVSGLAIGCDSVAHNACVKFKGKTIATLGSTCYHIYPEVNKQLANDIVKKGGLLIYEYAYPVDFVDKHKWDDYHYEHVRRLAERDRLQSLLSDAALVIDAVDNSGTSVAVKKNIKDKKPVFQLKGSRMTIIKNIIDWNDDVNDIITKAIGYKK